LRKSILMYLMTITLEVRLGNIGKRRRNRLLLFFFVIVLGHKFATDAMSSR